tara:strand:+ start:8082 stop:9719 length:1638 start_codon:yes stop_codon:yes gene_type:complete
MREDVDWSSAARESLLLKAVNCWREDSEVWFDNAYERLPETVRVNSTSKDFKWVEEWLKSIDCEPISWFEGKGSAWNMPFYRGKAQGEVKTLLASLHDTGRLTRQEAVSMLPVIALQPSPGDIVLDMCASPGSKTTQIAEYLEDSGVVVANEIIRGRVNLLVSNIQRHRSSNAIVVNHDARYIPLVPQNGYDKILVDAPCTGTGTTRKNPDVWSRWKPNDGRSMQKLQIDILLRATRLIKPSGKIVYSTCSLDPIENEAVVAEVLRKNPNLKLISAHERIPKLNASKGMKKWPLIDDNCSIIQDEIKESFKSPTEKEIQDQLPMCMRVWNDQSGGGGFFLAIFEASKDENDNKLRKVEQRLTEENAPMDPDNTPRPINSEEKQMLEKYLGEIPENLWIRGKKILWSTPQINEIWMQERSRKSGRIRIPGERWKPLKVIHLGIEVIHLRKGIFERIIGSAASKIADYISLGITEVSGEKIDRLLAGEEPEPGEVNLEIAGIRGSHLLRDSSDGTTIPVWVGGRVTLMLRNAEKIVLSAIRNIEKNQ